MEKIINSYECMFIVNLANGEDVAKTTVNKFTDLITANAEVIQIDEWGKRRLAYPIEDMNEGYYTVVSFKSEGAFPAELQRLMNIDESVMRAMVIRLDGEPVVKAAEVPADEAIVSEAANEENSASDAE